MNDFFDAFIMLGDGLKKPRFNTNTPQGALAMMDHFGIKKALVRTVEQDVCADDGNRSVLAFTEKSERLIPTWAVLPYQTGEFPAPEDLPGAMNRSGVKALFCDPSKTYSTRKTFMGDLFAVCESKNIPVLVPCPDYAAYEKADEILIDFPRLSLIACNAHSWGLERYTYPLFERYPNFALCLGPCRVSGAIQDTILRYGSGRIVFGSNYPVNEPGGACEVLRRLDITDWDREKIMHGNLELILAGVRV